MKKLVVLLFVIIHSASAQTPAWIWAAASGGSDYDGAAAVCTDGATGDMIFTGAFRSNSIDFNGIVLNNKMTGFNDVYVVKYDYSGQVTWAVSFGGDDLDIGIDTYVDQSGNIYVTGQFRSAFMVIDNDTLFSNGNFDWFLIKFDTNGNYLWGRSGGGAGIEAGISLTGDANGNIYMAGNFASPSFTFGTGTVVNSAGTTNDIFLLQFTPAGGSGWSRIAGGVSNDFAQEITTDNLGNLYVTGNFFSNVVTASGLTINNTSAVTSDIYLLKYSLTGTVLIAKGFGGSGSEISSDISIYNGSLVISGSFTSSTFTVGNTVLTNASSSGFYNNCIFKSDLAGNVDWAISCPSTQTSGIHSIAHLPSGNLYFGGFFESNITIGGQLYSSNGPADIFLAEMDTSGNVINSLVAGESGLDNLADLDIHGGNAIVTGTFYSDSITFGATTLQNNGNFDIYIAEYGFPVSINEVAMESITLFPNPSDGEVHIRSKSVIESLKVYNNYGQLITSRKLSDYKLDLVITVDGVYLIEMMIGERRIVKRFIISHKF